MRRAYKGVVEKAVEGDMWKKFASPTASRGKTAWPKGKDNQESVGIRYDYDGEVTRSDGVYHKFQIQPNAGKIPPTFKTWRDNNGGTHKVMATAFVKKDGTKDDVKTGLDAAIDDIVGSSEPEK
ncbi:hypothetical protein Aspvir_006948 [Aspergillus viridinutans]|uniref:Uncharacterized protein n=1 Tax=Aspergillus viridinutans TaxID=75553 RepID=A0A9P3BU11_ASPVI|nr:uncharacterized protein Aspvir_006948 [Aspergillus viridinutans]GIK02885.1 hypothetical protein Aspvir_006948 [Aspergillus viridinutans]